MRMYCYRQLKCRYFCFFECALTSNPVATVLKEGREGVKWELGLAYF